MTLFLKDSPHCVARVSHHGVSSVPGPLRGPGFCSPLVLGLPPPRSPGTAVFRAALRAPPPGVLTAEPRGPKGAGLCGQPTRLLKSRRVCLRVPGWGHRHTVALLTARSGALHGLNVAALKTVGLLLHRRRKSVSRQVVRPQCSGCSCALELGQLFNPCEERWLPPQGASRFLKVTNHWF